MAFEKSTEACCGNGNGNSDENEDWSDINTDDEADDDNGLSYFDK